MNLGTGGTPSPHPLQECDCELWIPATCASCRLSSGGTPASLPSPAGGPIPWPHGRQACGPGVTVGVALGRAWSFVSCGCPPPPSALRPPRGALAGGPLLPQSVLGPSCFTLGRKRSLEGPGQWALGLLKGPLGKLSLKTVCWVILIWGFPNAGATRGHPADPGLPHCVPAR